MSQHPRAFHLILLTLLWIVSNTVFAETFERVYLQHKFENGSLSITTNDGRLAITPFSQKVVEVIFFPENEAEAHATSWSVVQRPESPPIKINENANELSLDTQGLRILIDKAPLRLRYYFKDKALTNEHQGYFSTAASTGFSFQLADDEIIYGGGARALPMDRRGFQLSLYNTPAYGYGKERKDMYFSLPLIMSSKRYMLLYDNAAKGVLDIGEEEKNVIRMQSVGGRKAYYLIAGDSFFDLNQQYTKLTGRQALPPRWLLGNISSRFGYRNQAEAEMTVRKYREKQVPVDAMVIDLFWFGEDIKGHMGNLAWDRKAWPTPKRMMQKFAEQDVKTVLISEPFIVKTSKRWEEAQAKNILAKTAAGEDYVIEVFYFGPAGLIDIFKPKAQNWLWDIYKNLMHDGVDGWWGDLGEPEKHPDDMIHVNGPAPLVHNVYGHEWAKLIYEGYQKDFPHKRPMTLMRAGFAGSQRYGMVPWTGDVSRNWEGLSSQPAMTMQMGMQGLAYMHSDLGGFAPDKRKDGTVFSDPTLYVRWLQYGVFQPVFRPHSHESSPPEPIFWREPILALTRQAVNLRYRLLPYNYSLAYENATRGYPLMRPLFYYDENNSDLLDYSDAYMWGDNILVAPILQAQQKQQDVVFPKGSRWLDFYNPEKMYQGGSKQTVPVVDSSIPTFIRSGSFIPMFPLAEHSQPHSPSLTQPFTQQNNEKKDLLNSTNYTGKALEIFYFVDRNVSQSQYTLFEDDGITKQNFDHDSYELLFFKAHRENDQQHFSVSSNGGDYSARPERRRLKFIVGNLEDIPQSVQVEKTRFILNPASRSYSKVNQGTSNHKVTLNNSNQIVIDVLFEREPVSFYF